MLARSASAKTVPGRNIAQKANLAVSSMSRSVIASSQRACTSNQDEPDRGPDRTRRLGGSSGIDHTAAPPSPVSNRRQPLAFCQPGISFPPPWLVRINRESAVCALFRRLVPVQIYILGTPIWDGRGFRGNHTARHSVAPALPGVRTPTAQRLFARAHSFGSAHER